jgi:hypothetical protein
VWSACLGVNRIKKNFCKSKSILQCACGVTIKKLNMAIGYTDRSSAASARAELQRFSSPTPSQPQRRDRRTTKWQTSAGAPESPDSINIVMSSPYPLQLSDRGHRALTQGRYNNLIVIQNESCKSITLFESAHV